MPEVVDDSLLFLISSISCNFCAVDFFTALFCDFLPVLGVDLLSQLKPAPLPTVGLHAGDVLMFSTESPIEESLLSS